jgi:hypothetical protein
LGVLIVWHKIGVGKVDMEWRVFGVEIEGVLGVEMAGVLGVEIEGCWNRGV